MDWIDKLAEHIVIGATVPTGPRGEYKPGVVAWVRATIERHLPEPPLLQCPDCGNTESCAGAMARQFNRGRCLHCGGLFKVVRA